MENALKKYSPPIALKRLRPPYYKTLKQRIVAKTANLPKPETDQKLIARLRYQIECLSFKFRSVFDSSHSYFIILDMEMKILDFNRASFRLVKKLFGNKMVIGESILDFLHPSSTKMITDSCTRALSGEKFTVQRKVSYESSGITWWSFEFSPATDLDGNITGLVFNANDITKRKAYENRIRSQHKKLMEISSLQSHEIRGPVSTIMGLMQMIKEENYKPDKMYLLLLELTTEQLDKNIREIVDLAHDD
jgi:PAS domain S-box-containing protein